MAISVPSLSRANFTSGTGSDVTVTFPTADMQKGDWVFILGGHYYRAEALLGPTTAGWTRVYDTAWKANYNVIGCWYKLWNGTETEVTCHGTEIAGDPVAYGRIVLRGNGRHKSYSGGSGASNNPSPTSVFANPGDCILVCGVSDVSDVTPGILPNYITVNGNVDSTRDMSISIGYRLNPNTPIEDPGSWNSWSALHSETISIEVSEGIVTSLHTTEATDIVELVSSTPADVTFNTTEIIDTLQATATTEWQVTLGATDLEDSVYITDSGLPVMYMGAREGTDVLEFNNSTYWSSTLISTEESDIMSLRESDLINRNKILRELKRLNLSYNPIKNYKVFKESGLPKRILKRL